jgi:glycosyltransferase involved in cell wall biosynthesis
MLKLNPLSHPICLTPPNRLTPGSAWHEHIPFAMFLVDLLRPKVIVELGTQYGDSYCAFCQAVKELHLDTLCYAVGNWQGAPHAGFHGDEVLADLRAHHDPLYGSFSRLIQSTSDAALEHFADGTVDLLHIDSDNTYQSIRHDFETWLPKMSPHGVVLLHDTNVREHDFGTRIFWDEVKSQYPHFEFPHGHGLGILAVGGVCSQELQDLFEVPEEDSARIRDFFFQLGHQLTTRVREEARASELERQLQELKTDHDYLEISLGKSLLEIEVLRSLNQLKIVRQLGTRYQRIVERLLRPGTRRRHYYELMLSDIGVILSEGWRSFWSRFKRRFRGRSESYHYQVWIAQNEPKMQDLDQQKQQSLSFNYRPKISIITPVRNTKAKWLKAAIESVLNQTYDNWELCLTDGKSTRPQAKKLLQEYARKDTRIKVKFLQENKGISGICNEALSLAAGEFIGLLDHDGELAPFALHEVAKCLDGNPDLDFIYSDEDMMTDDGNRRFSPLFKPGWSPETMLSANYLGHLCVIRKSLVGEVGGFLPETDGAQDWDLFFRVTERTNKIHHIPEILYHCKTPYPSYAKESLRAKPYVLDAQRKTQQNHLDRQGLAGNAVLTPSGSWRINWLVSGQTKVSIIIPTKDKMHLLQRCVESVLERTPYTNFELIIVDTGSIEPETFRCYDELLTNPKVRIIEYKNTPFNYSAVNNFGVRSASGDALLFLNNDTEVITPNWLEEMVGWVEQKPIGVVGAKLLNDDGTIQNGGMVIGLAGFGLGLFYGVPEGHWTIFGSTEWYRNLLAVAATCMMMRRQVFEEVGGFDESFILAHGDLELCLRCWERGYRSIYTPFVKVRHYFAQTRGEYNPPNDYKLWYEHSKHILSSGDPYHNPNLSCWSSIPSFKKAEEAAVLDFAREFLKVEAAQRHLTYRERVASAMARATKCNGPR